MPSPAYNEYDYRHADKQHGERIVGFGCGFHLASRVRDGKLRIGISFPPETCSIFVTYSFHLHSHFSAINRYVWGGHRVDKYFTPVCIRDIYMCVHQG